MHCASKVETCIVEIIRLCIQLQRLNGKLMGFVHLPTCLAKVTHLTVALAKVNPSIHFEEEDINVLVNV